MSRQIFKNVPKADPQLQQMLDSVKQQEPTNAGGQRARGLEAGPDREVWVRNQVMTAMRMALALRDERGCGADRDAYEVGFRGVANGATIEILRTLGFETDNLVNIHKF